MRKLTSSDLKNLKLLQHYRVIRKWACKTCNIKDADLELLMYLDGLDLFTKQDFKMGTYSYSWDNRRWNRLLKEGWIVVWRKRNRTTQKYHLYKTSTRFKHLLSRIYRIMLGEENMPNINTEGYMSKVLNKSIINLNADKKRGNG
jgi:hypothetical protein